MAEGNVDFKGCMGIDAAALVGITSIKLQFSARMQSEAQIGRHLETLRALTEQYSVILQTLKSGLDVETSINTM